MSEHVGGVHKMKNNNKNYIKEFMNDNGLIINVPFDTIQGGRFFSTKNFDYIISIILTMYMKI